MGYSEERTQGSSPTPAPEHDTRGAPAEGTTPPGERRASVGHPGHRGVLGAGGDGGREARAGADRLAGVRDDAGAAIDAVEGRLVRLEGLSTGRAEAGQVIEAMAGEIEQALDVAWSEAAALDPSVPGTLARWQRVEARWTALRARARAGGGVG